MSKDLFSQETRDVTAEACAWIAQLETGELTAADVDAFREWVRRSPRHAAEIRRLARVSMDLNVLTEMAGPLQEAAAHYRSIVGRGKGRWVGFRASALGALAVVAAVVVIAAFLLVFKNIAPEQSFQVATAVGDFRDVTLSDGTSVKLNTDSRIEVHYSAGERTIRLLAGEAYFDVMPDPDWPFLVYANGKSVRAVGTAFVVRVLAEMFEVTVVEGRVELMDTIPPAGDQEQGPETVAAESRAEPDAAPPATMILEAGQRVSIRPRQQGEGTIVTLSPRDVQRQLSWQEGLHDFSDTPLEDVMREIGRYSPLEIEIADPELRGIRFGGLFRIGDTEPLFDALQETFGINVEYLDDEKVRLSLAAQ